MDQHEECRYIAEQYRLDAARIQRDKMWYRRALYLACGGDKDKVKRMMSDTEFTILNHDGTQREIVAQPTPPTLTEKVTP